MITKVGVYAFLETKCFQSFIILSHVFLPLW